MRDYSHLAANCRFVNAEVNADKTGAVWAGAWASMKNYGHATIIILTGTLTATDTMTITCNQATAVAGTGIKALVFDYWYSGCHGAAVIDDTLVMTAQATTAMTITGTDDDHIFIIELDAEMLDVDNSFDCFNVAGTSPGAHVCDLQVIYILGQARYLPTKSAIID